MNGVWTARSVAAVAVGICGYIVGSGNFPSGADLANLLHHGRTVAGGGLPAYPPLLPVVGAAIWSLANGDFDTAVGLIRFLPAAALVFAAWSAHRVVAAWSGPEPVPSIAAAAVAANGVVWSSLTWGAIPMLVSFACMLLAFAAWHQEIGSRRPWRTVSWTCAAIAANPYPVLFAGFSIASLAMVWRQDAWQTVRRQGVWAAVPAMVTIVVYGLMLPTAKSGSAVAAAGPQALWFMTARQAGTLGGGAALLLIALAVVVVSAFATGVGRSLIPWAVAGAGMILGALLAQAVTVMNLVGRGMYALAILAALVVAVVAGASRDTSRTAGRVVGPALLALAVVGLPMQVALTVPAADYYRPPYSLRDAMQAIPGGGGDILVTGPDPPTLDAWWLRAGTGREVWVAGEPWPHTFLPDQARNLAARLWMEGTGRIQAGDAVVASGGCTGSGLSISHHTLQAGMPLAIVPDAGAYGVGAGGATLGGTPEHQESVDGMLIDSSGEGESRWERRVTSDGQDFRLEWWAPAAAAWSVTLSAPPGGRFTAVEENGSLVIRVDPPTALSAPPLRIAFPPGARVETDAHWIRADVDAPSLAVTIQVGHSAGRPETVVAADQLEETGIKYVFSRSTQPVPRISHDHSLRPVWTDSAAGAVLYMVHRGDACADPTVR